MQKEKTVSNYSSYLDVCRTNEVLEHLYESVMSPPIDNNRGSTSVKDIKLMNSIMHGYAEIGNFQKISKVLNRMINEKILISAANFAPALECIGRNETSIGCKGVKNDE